MRAVIAKDQIPTLIEIPTPLPGGGEVLVRVRATALNRADLMQVAGGYPPPEGAPHTLGLELAGEVEAVGEGVTRFAVGDRVMSLVGGGGYADYALAPADTTLPLPENLSFVQGGALMEAFLTAYSNMFDLGRLAPGETLLIHAGASGVGLAASQMAKVHGAHIAVTASAGKHEVCREYGAHLTIDYKTENFADRLLQTYPDGVDLVLEMVGAPYWDDNVRVLKKWGRIVFIGLQAGAMKEVNFGQIMAKRLTVTGSTLRNRRADLKAKLVADFGRWALPKFKAGTLRPVIFTTMPLDDVAGAHEMMKTNRNAGKIVLTT